MTEQPIALSEDDLRELFALFTSCTEYERNQVYSPQSTHYFLSQNLSEEYSLTEGKREYALDAWRAVLYFLNKRGYCLCKNGEDIDLSFINEAFIP